MSDYHTDANAESATVTFDSQKLDIEELGSELKKSVLISMVCISKKK